MKYRIYITLLVAVGLSWVAYAGELPESLAALAGSDPAARAAAFESAGQYGPEAIEPVAELLDSEDPGVVRAAKLALEKIVGANLPTGLERKEWQGDTARRQVSEALCQAIEDVQCPEGRNWLLWLLSYAGASEAVPDLVGLMTKPQAFDMMVFALQSIGLSESAAGLYARLSRDMPAEQQVAILNALGAINCNWTAQHVMEYVGEDEPVGQAAIEALGRIGALEGEDAVWSLLETSQAPHAVDAYVRIAENQEPKAAGRMYAKLLDIADTPNTQCAALLGLGQTGTPKNVKDMLPFLSAERADVYHAASTALTEIEGTKATKRLIKAMKKAEPPVKSALLTIVAARDAERAQKPLDKAMKDENAEVRVTAIMLLGLQDDPAYAETFLEAAGRGSVGARPEAVRGYLHLADLALPNDGADKALGMYHAALSVATRNEEKRMALRGMTQIGSSQSIPQLESNLYNETILPDIIECGLAVADNVASSDTEMAQAIYEAVLERASDRKQAARAVQGLRGLGVDIDPAADGGFITHWRIIGPFAKTSFEAVYPPENEYVADAEYDGAAGKVTWTDWHVDDFQGVTFLDQICIPKENVIAYARAEITVGEARDVLIKMGSDDGIVCWLNGERIHENNASRGVAVDQDVKEARLQAGKNVLLVKIVQGGGDWAFCVRLTDRDGTPLKPSDMAVAAP